MKSALPARVVDALRAYWKVGTVVVAGIGWAFASSAPKLAVSSKLRFAAFLLRVYWPELMVIALAGAGLVWIGRTCGLHGNATAATLAAWRRRASRVLGQVSVGRIAVGVMAVVATFAFVTITVVRQAVLVVEAQQTFAAIRLMNWYGDDLHRVGQQLIETGQYDIAARTFKLQARDLGNDLEEGRSASTVAQWLEAHINERSRIVQLLQAQIQQSGVERRHLLLQGTWTAVLPPGPLHAPEQLEMIGAGELTRYRDALGRLKTACDEGKADTLTARQIGEAASALGFARSADLLFGSATETAARAELLCGIAALHGAEDLQQMSLNAFSVRKAPSRDDWRRELPVATLLTPPSWVLRAGVNAVRAQVERFTGIDLRRRDVTSESSDAEADAQPSATKVEAIEMGQLALLDVEPPETDYASLSPVIYHGPLVLPGFGGVEPIDAYLLHDGGEPVLLLCEQRRPGDATTGLLLREDLSVHLMPAASPKCAADSTNQALDRRTTFEMAAALLMRWDSGERSAPASAKGTEVRGLLCRALVAKPRHLESREARDAYRLCPLHAYAAKVPLPESPAHTEER
ncbi:hypothetical protein J2X16_002345 [Pelomonas aquatica]|uniref:Uncharacterized protein n=1 Tax=Pelomonas aquatica TaxID=431058 RepID=A0ABU1Z8R7_9BURK|nr:hypothetical protein [Pelomonas aquatica]MDR7296998.1 hypothetical protein [Pelomonas aquatica]